MENNMKIIISSDINNIVTVRTAVVSHVSTINNISVDDVLDIKTAVNEAVSNAIEHGYNEYKGDVEINVNILDNNITIKVIDKGIGIPNIDLALTPSYTSKPELEHAGLGFTIMENFMDSIVVDSTVNEGTTIILTKEIKNIEG